MVDNAKKLSQNKTGANPDESYLPLYTIESDSTLTMEYKLNSGSEEDILSVRNVVNDENYIQPSASTSDYDLSLDSIEDPLSVICVYINPENDIEPSTSTSVYNCLDVNAENDIEPNTSTQLPITSSTKQQLPLPCYKQPDEDSNCYVGIKKRRIFHYKPEDRYPNFYVDMSGDSENEMQDQIEDDTDKDSTMQTETGCSINVAKASEKKLHNFISEGPKDRKIVTINSITLYRCDMQTLLNWNWLNDQIINAYMTLIVERNTSIAKLPSIFAMDTFFVQQLKLSRNMSLETLTKNVNIFEIDLVLIPVNLMENHWALITIDMKLCTINYYDSLIGRPIKDTFQLITRYLQQQQRKFGNMDKKFEIVTKKTSQQLNTWDCGVYMCMFADRASRCAPIRFSNRTVSAYRTKMLRSILLRKLSVH